MNAAHLHLLLNHVPTVGTATAVGLLLLASARRSAALAHAALELLVVIAILTLPAYVTGAAAQAQLRDTGGISDTAVQIHQDAALVGFTVLEFAGFLAWAALWQWRRLDRLPPRTAAAAGVLAVLALGAMARAATLGGEIRHPEIRASAEARTIVADEFVSSAVSSYMVNSRWAWPAAETLHFLGLSLSLGVLLAVNLRILGVARQGTFADAHRLLPWGMLGFGVNLVTGMLFFVAQGGQYIGSAPFAWKIVLLMLAGAHYLYLTVFRAPWADANLDSPPAHKAMAVASIAVWGAVLYAGRMLPFLGNAF